MEIDKLPKDPVMLLSFVNTRMRDQGIDLEALSVQFGVDSKIIQDELNGLGYTYDSEIRRFV